MKLLDLDQNIIENNIQLFRLTHDLNHEDYPFFNIIIGISVLDYNVRGRNYGEEDNNEIDILTLLQTIKKVKSWSAYFFPVKPEIP